MKAKALLSTRTPSCLSNFTLCTCHRVPHAALRWKHYTTGLLTRILGSQSLSLSPSHTTASSGGIIWSCPGPRDHQETGHPPLSSPWEQPPQRDPQPIYVAPETGALSTCREGGMGEGSHCQCFPYPNTNEHILQESLRFPKMSSRKHGQGPSN